MKNVFLKYISLIFVFYITLNPLSANDSTATKSNTIAILPVLFYTPETGVAGGGLVNYNFYNQDSDLKAFPSTLMPSLVYTEKNQITAALFSDIYWQDNTYHFMGNISLVRFPNKFYGIGKASGEDDEENYTSNAFELECFLQKKIIEHFEFGIAYNFKYENITTTDRGGQLIKEEITGSQAGASSGAGLIFTIDNRDNKFYPGHGCFHQITYMYFGPEIGSDYQYNHFILNLRKYFTLLPGHIFALQSLGSFMSGSVPFHNMATLGGAYILRGYYEGRYRDKNAFVFQSEYRLPLFWRFGAVMFASLGDVAGRLSSFKINTFKYTYGGGIRFLLNKKEKLNIRLDLGFSETGSALYITLAETF